MRREKLHQFANEAILTLDYLEGACMRSNDLERIKRLLREERRTLMQIQAEVLDYRRED